MQNSTIFAAGVLLVALGVSGAAGAQTSNNRVDANKDWSIFVETEPNKMCWVVSTPTKVVNSREGVRRGEIQLMVTYRSGAQTAEVAFTGGYPFKPESVVKLQIGTDSFDLYPEGEWAWPVSAADDGRIQESMKAGAEALLTAESSRGTVTKDTFSLIGFTDALTAAKQNCS